MVFGVFKSVQNRKNMFLRVRLLAVFQGEGRSCCGCVAQRIAHTLIHRSLAGCSMHNLGSGQRVAASGQGAVAGPSIASDECYRGLQGGETTMCPPGPASPSPTWQHDPQSPPERPGTHALVRVVLQYC